MKDSFFTSYLMVQSEESELLINQAPDDQIPRMAMMKTFHMLQQFMEELPLDGDPEKLLGGAIRSVAGFLASERAGRFIFAPNRKMPRLRDGLRLNEAIIHSLSFQPLMDILQKAHETGLPLWQWKEENDSLKNPKAPLFQLCLPVSKGKESSSVLYYEGCRMSGMKGKDDELLRNFCRMLLFTIRKHCNSDRRTQTDLGCGFEEYTCREMGEEPSVLIHLPDIEALFQKAAVISGTDATVLIRGDTGTGKEIFAKWLHDKSRRRKKPLVTIDPSSIPETLVESEFFGHEKGAFTGANHQKTGYFELANNSTLFIDELAEIPLSIQTKLLRVLQEKSFCRVGSGRTICSDFRLITATNRDLKKEVREGRFREDLFYRINVIELHLPRLQDRRRDLLLLAEHFLSHYKQKYQHPHLALTEKTRKRIMKYNWPGNVRQLKNTLERAVLMADPEQSHVPILFDSAAPDEDFFHALPTLDDLQRRYIEYTLKKTGGRISGPKGAAEILGLKRTTLHARMKKLGIV